MRKLMHDLGIAGRGKQMTRVVETLKGEGELVSSTAKNIVTYNLEVVEETGIAPMSPSLRTIAGCVALLYSDLELSHRWKDSRYTCKMEGSCRCSAKDRDGLLRRVEFETTDVFNMRSSMRCGKIPSGSLRLLALLGPEFRPPQLCCF